MTAPVVTRSQVEPADAHRRDGVRPHVGVLVSLNYPGIAEDHARLVRRFTGTTLRALVALGASYELLDSSDPAALGSPDADALLILGGGDICPDLAGQGAAAPSSYGVDRAADVESIRLVHEFADTDRPVLGICRGSQLVNVSYGGTIIPDLEDYRLHHGGPDEPLFLDEKIEVEPGTRLAGLIGPGPVTVRSGHHQAVDRVGDGLVVAARALDGVIEAVEHPTRWVVGVQFHPEDDDGGDRELLLLLTGLLDGTRT